VTAGTWDQFRAHTLCAMLNGLRVFDVSHGHTSAPLAAASGGSGRLDHDLTPGAAGARHPQFHQPPHVLHRNAGTCTSRDRLLSLRIVPGRVNRGGERHHDPLVK
jgi:hypothetical protein